MRGCAGRVQSWLVRRRSGGHGLEGVSPQEPGPGAAPGVNSETTCQEGVPWASAQAKRKRESGLLGVVRPGAEAGHHTCTDATQL